jgi:hypothetical protein
VTACIAPTPSASGYKYRGCQCPDCAEAYRVRQRHRRRMIAYGRWEGLVDAEPVRQYIRALIDGSLSRERIAELAGVSNGCLTRILYGHNKEEGPTRKVQPDTARRILGVRPTLDDYSDAAMVDVVGTRRRAQALVAIGWSLSEQARRVGREHKHYSPLLKRERVPARLARAVRGLYDNLAMTPAPAGYSATRSRRMAAQQGWHAPLDWEGTDIDDPTSVPDAAEEPPADMGDVDVVAVERALAGERMELTDAELVAVLQVGVARGEPLSRLSERLGINYFGARKMLGGELTPRREKQQRVEAEILRSAAGDYVIAAQLGVARSTVSRARARLVAAGALEAA